MLKLILQTGESLVGKLLLYDALDMSFQTVQLRENSRCRVCGEQADIHELIDYEQFCGVPTVGRLRITGISEIEPTVLALRLAHGEDVGLLDVRDPVALQVSASLGRW